MNNLLQSKKSTSLQSKKFTSFGQLYSKEVLKHVRNPKNLGVIKNPDGEATIGNRVCGDIMKIYIKVNLDSQKREFIKDVKFQTLGCGAAIATSSMITTLVKGKLLTEAEIVSKQLLINKLGGLPKEKIHCSVLAEEALKKAITDYRSKQATRSSITSKCQRA